jgi:hypothetical protein
MTGACALMLFQRGLAFGVGDDSVDGEPGVHGIALFG